jgi:TP901 family phage tail tape measure protein
MNSMLGSTAELAILIKLKDEITGPLNNIDRSLSGLNNRSASVSSGMTKIGAGLALGAERVAVGLIAVGGSVAVMVDKATNAAATYQSAMELVHTQAGASQAEVDSMSAALLKLAPEVGTNATALAAGLYHIESAGVRGSKALDMLRTAAEGAKVGQADLEDVTNALVGAVNTGIKGTENMGAAMGTLNGIVGSGNMRMADLTGAIATGILPTAKSMGLTLKDVGAALADMTDQGVPAVDAATRLRMTFSLMAAPTGKASDVLKSIGMSSTQMAEDMRKPNGLLVALTDLKKHLSGLSAVEQTQAVSAAFGGGRTSSTILTLLGSLDRLDSKYKAITASTNDFGNAWDSTALTIDQRKEAMAAGFDSLKIQLGDQLLPVEGKVLDALTKLVASPAVTQGIQDFGTALAGLFTDENIASAEKFLNDVVPQIKDFATSVLPPLEEGLKITGAAAKTAFDMFMSLPEPVKAAVIAALAANKLTGGLVASGIGDLAKVAMGAATGTSGGGIAGGMLGVQKVFVVNMGVGGMGGGLGGGASLAGEGSAAGGGGLAAIAAGALPAALILAATVGGIEIAANVADPSGSQAASYQDQAARGQYGTRQQSEALTNAGYLSGGTQSFDAIAAAAAQYVIDHGTKGEPIKATLDPAAFTQTLGQYMATAATQAPHSAMDRAGTDLAASATVLQHTAGDMRAASVHVDNSARDLRESTAIMRLTPPTVSVVVNTAVSVRDINNTVIQAGGYRTTAPR